MIETVQGNVLTLTEGIIVHGCNCQGVMGSGIAKSIRDAWPAVYDAYRRHYLRVGLHLGDVVAVAHPIWHQTKVVARHLHDTTEQLPERLILVNALTQDEYGRDPNRVYVDYDGLAAAFARIRVLARDTGLPVHFPLIGCGLANGEWEQVSARIDQMLGQEVKKTLWVLPPA
jgi:O-acetyl-ADP-ribose deacetylase (regulator of RNase III)